MAISPKSDNFAPKENPKFHICMTLYFSKQRFACLCLWAFCLTGLFAQIPADYYASSKGKKGKALKTALFQIIGDHKVRSYSQLWEDFKSTDVRPDGKIWDMYSNTTNYTPGGPEQGRNYKAEGDAYNREHSFPKSWFSDASPMYTDLYHLYPTDGYVNNRRSNYPFGETKGETYQSEGGFSKLGKSSLSGYSGTVFEPADEYKGDFARTYFYMATAYEDCIASWSSPMLAGNSYPAYASWALTMLLRWAQDDPVSEKEMARAQAVYEIQGNRNPFIDFPGLEQYVWGSKTSVAFDPDKYDDSTGEITEVECPVFTPAGGTVEAGTRVTISCGTPDASICYTLQPGSSEVVEVAAPATLVINETSQVEAYARLGQRVSETVSATFTVTGTTQPSTLYELVTDGSSLASGETVLIVCTDKGRALSAQSGDYRTWAEVIPSDDATPHIDTEVGDTDLPYALELDLQEDDCWSLFSPAEAVYLALTKNDNKLYADSQAESETSWWTIDVSAEGKATIASVAYPARSIQYNHSAPRFACYSSQQGAVSLFRRAPAATSIASPNLPGRSGLIVVYTLSGQLAAMASSTTEALRALPQGIYVIGGKKYYVR